MTGFNPFPLRAPCGRTFAERKAQQSQAGGTLQGRATGNLTRPADRRSNP